MGEEQAEYITDAMKVMGAGYSDQPAAIIDPPRMVRALRDKGIGDYKVWGWVKKSTNFIYHIKILKGSKLAIWDVISLSIDEDGTCNLSAPEIAELTGYSVSEVRQSISELDEMGYLSVIRATGKRSIYTPEFAARGSNNPTDNPSRKSTPPVGKGNCADDPSSPSIENFTPSIKRVKRVKRVKTTSQIKGIEAALFSGRPVTSDDLPIMENALREFETALSLPANWNWYPAKTSEEKAWRELRDFVLEKWQSDNQSFRKYAAWRATPYVKGALSNLAIQRKPYEFITSWSDYLASSSMYGSSYNEEHRL